MNAQAPRGGRGVAARLGTDDGWGPATSVRTAAAQPATGRQAPDVDQRAVPRVAGQRPRDRRAANRLASQQRYGRPAQQQVVPDRGLPGWAALLLLLVIAGIGGVIDVISGSQIRGGFNVGVVIASVVAILVVRRSAMFPVVVAPPIVYAVASGAMLYVRSGGLHDRRALFDAAANWLVYGFPAIAAATAAVLIIAGIRLIVRR
ncbi:MAG: DUF6542 domain-containing protein [Jatrophihabitantaceae bacterium]